MIEGEFRLRIEKIDSIQVRPYAAAQCRSFSASQTKVVKLYNQITQSETKIGESYQIEYRLQRRCYCIIRLKNRLIDGILPLI